MYRLCLVVLLGVWHASAQLTTPAPGSAIDCNVVGIQNCGKCNLPGMTCAFCADNFVLAADYKSCIACDPNCLDCVLDSTGKIGMCQLCAPGYEVKSDGTCGQCGTFCATCTFTDAAETQTDCLACFPTSATVLYPYLLGSYSKQCQDCTQVTPGCSSCSEAADKSLSCTGCQPGYVSVSNAGVKTCTSCPSNCLSCSIPKGATSPTTCATCKTNFVANSATTITASAYACLYCDPTKCSKCSTTAVSSNPYIAQCSTCQKGYYLDGSKICQPCPAGCATCTSATVCQSCVSSGFFFDSANTKCIACSLGCNTCTFSATSVETCTACIAGYGLQSSGVSCQECPPYCTACSDPATCTACDDTQPVEFWLVADVDGTFCMPCPANCLTCADGGNYAAVCSTCANGYVAGTDAEGDSFCFPCSSHCTTCTVDQNTYQTTCTVCETGTTTNLEYYLTTAGTCTSCGVGCNDCSGTNNACNDCKDGYFFDNTGATPKCTACTVAKCKICTPDAATCTTCVDGYYYDSASTSCKPCAAGCTCSGAAALCVACTADPSVKPKHAVDTAQSECLTCDSNCDTCTTDAVCSACAPGYVPDTAATDTGKTCVKCDPNCASGQCTAGGTAGKTAICAACVDGYYVNSNDGCTKCPSGCTCDASASSVCTGCLPAYTMVTSSSGTITCPPNPTGCATGTLDSNNAVTCSLCDDYYGMSSKTPGVCESCPAYCITCSADPLTDLQVCSQCDDGYAENKFACSECPEGCTSCRNVNGAMFCTQCTPQGYYLDSKNGVCIACLQCSSCSASGCNAGTCDDGYGLASDQTCTDCATLTTVSGCTNCTDADSTGMAMCLDCDNGQVLDGWGANCVDASSLGDCVMPEFRPYECTPGSCNSPFEWVTDGPGRGQCGLHCAVCGDLSRGLFLAECQNANNNYTQELVVGACWVGRTVDSAGNVLYARGGFDKFNCTSDNQWEFVDPSNSATTYKCCQSGDGCSDEIALDGVAGASAISFSLALLFASILAALRLF